MRYPMFIVLVIVLRALPCPAQTFDGTNLDPFEPPYSPPPFSTYNNRVVSVTFETSSNVVEALVPDPLDTLGGTQISVKAIDYGFYTEALLEIPVSHQGVSGFYYVILYLDHALAIISGRELWGFSKVDADIDIVWSGDDVVAISVSKLGTNLITINADFGTESGTSAPMAVDSAYNLKLVPSAEAGGDPDVCEITRMDSTHTVSDLRTGTGTLEFGRIATAPMDAIPVYGLVDVSTFYWDVTLPFGLVVWDYLAQPGGCTIRFTEPFIFTDSFESGDTSVWSTTAP